MKNKPHSATNIQSVPNIQYTTEQTIEFIKREIESEYKINNKVRAFYSMQNISNLSELTTSTTSTKYDEEDGLSNSSEIIGLIRKNVYTEHDSSE